MDRDYYPIRQRMLWVGVVQLVATTIALVFTQVEVDQWVKLAVGVIDLLVMAGVLAGGTTRAEQNTTPVDNTGEPLNPDYTRVAG